MSSETLTPRSIAVFHSPLSLLHNPPYEILSGVVKPYYEPPERYHLILDALLRVPSSEGPPVEGPNYPSFAEFALDWKPEDVLAPFLLDALRRVHDEDYLEFLKGIYAEWIAEGGKKACVLADTFLREAILLEPGGGSKNGAKAIEKAGCFSFDLSCPITADTWISAIASARVALEASKYLLQDPTPSRAVFALCRPPGHHSTPSLCGGYCYLNNSAVATRFIQDSRAVPGAFPTKVAILDIDYHHGNGTSKVFYDDPSVYYVSLHGSPDYPYFTGAATERGAGAGLGTNLNFPLPLGTDSATYLATLHIAVEKIREWEPEFVVVSLGVDTYIDDPITDFYITLDAYPKMGALIASLELPTVFLMEGGYCLPKIGACVRGVLEGFATAS